MDDGEQFVGRYGATEIVLEGLSLSPAFGYKVNDRFSVGGGVSFLYTRFNQDVAINQEPFQDGKVKFDDRDDWGARVVAHPVGNQIYRGNILHKAVRRKLPRRSK